VACSSTVGGQGAVSPSPSRSGAAAPLPTGSAQQPNAGVKSIVALTPTAPGPTAGSGDFTSARFATPAGFVRVSGYYQVVPLEDSYLSYYTKPKTELDAKGVIAVLIYTLPAPGLVDTAAQQRARITFYNRKVRATVRSPMTATTLAGLPAYREVLDQPGGFHYTAWFAFGSQHLLQLACQVGAPSEAAKITAGCESVRSTLRVS
jgi:hypothetical protein